MRVVRLQHSGDEVGLASVVLELDVMIGFLALPFEHTLILEKTAARHLLILPWAALLSLEHAVGVRAFVVALSGREAAALHDRVAVGLAS